MQLIHSDLPIKNLRSTRYCGHNSKQGRQVHVQESTIPLTDIDRMVKHTCRRETDKLERRQNEDNMPSPTPALSGYDFMNSYWEMTGSYYRSSTVYYLSACCTLNAYNVYRVHCWALVQPISFSYLDEVHNRRTLGSYCRWNSSTYFNHHYGYDSSA